MVKFRTRRGRRGQRISYPIMNLRQSRRSRKLVKVIVQGHPGGILEEEIFQEKDFLLTKHFDDFFNIYLYALYKKRDGNWVWYGKTFDLDQGGYAKDWIIAENKLRASAKLERLKYLDKLYLTHRISQGEYERFRKEISGEK